MWQYLPTVLYTPFYFKGDLKCHAMMRLFRGEFPSSKAKELGTYLEVRDANIQEFRKNNMGNGNGMPSIIG